MGAHSEKAEDSEVEVGRWMNGEKESIGQRGVYQKSTKSKIKVDSNLWTLFSDDTTCTYHVILLTVNRI